MRTLAVATTAILTAALLTSCNTSTDYDCDSAAPLYPAPVAQAAPVAPGKPRPPRTSRAKPNPTKPKAKTTPGLTHHHDFDDCDDD
ncbi:hypothetical protein AB0D09_02830 [Streptomyces sp. NPDC049097]|uniref:hypothetical protein n=1 Tax=Streptomyces sp. NPDC049097 TaxID=3155497 RepID=UPI003443B633